MFIHKYKTWLVEKQLDLFGHLIELDDVRDYMVELEDKYGQPTSVYLVGKGNGQTFIDTEETNVGDTVEVSLMVEFKRSSKDFDDLDDIRDIRKRIYQNFNVNLSSIRGTQRITLDIPCGSIHLDNKSLIKVANIKEMKWKGDNPYFETNLEFLWDSVISGAKEQKRYRDIFVGDMSNWDYDWLYSSDDVFDWESAENYYLRSETINRLRKILSRQFIKNEHDIEDVNDMSFLEMVDQNSDDYDLLNDIKQTYTDMYNNEYHDECRKSIESKFHKILDENGIVYTNEKDDIYLIDFDMSWTKERDSNAATAYDIFNQHCSDDFGGLEEVNPHFPDYASVDWKTFDKEVNTIIDFYEKRS